MPESAAQRHPSLSEVGEQWSLAARIVMRPVSSQQQQQQQQHQSTALISRRRIPSVSSSGRPAGRLASADRTGTAVGRLRRLMNAVSRAASLSTTAGDDVARGRLPLCHLRTAWRRLPWLQLSSCTRTASKITLIALLDLRPPSTASCTEIEDAHLLPDIIAQTRVS